MCAGRARPADVNTRPPLRAVERAREAQGPRDESGSPHFPTGVSFHTWITVPETHPEAWVKGRGPGLRSHRRALKGLQGKAVTRRLGLRGHGAAKTGPPELEGVLESPRAGAVPCSPLSAESPQLGLEVRAPGLQPTSPWSLVWPLVRGREGQELLGPQSGLGTESPLPVKLVPPLFR